ncbi:MAG TPA: FkbM family methyltransferase [Sulfurimonas sp.]|nr:FkbM family methyltransferase [Sulfurimonas sp.]
MKKFILRVLNKLKLLKFLNLTHTIEIGQNETIIPILGGIGFNNISISEVWMIDILERLSLKEDNVFIDVGVNIGQTLIKLKTVYPSIEYIGFEPNVSCVNYTESLIEKNRWTNIHLIPSGIAENVGLGILEHYADDITDSSASIIEDYRKGSVVYKRDIVTLLNVSSVEDTWKDKKVLAIKIDVEGAELGVLKSFRNILKEDKPYLLVEILPVYSSDNSQRLDNQLEIEKILKELEYNIYRIHKNVENRLESLEFIETIGIHNNLDWCDYIFSSKILKV